MTQLVYTMFIINNCASFHLCWKENLVKHQKVSKYYENDCGFCVSGTLGINRLIITIHRLFILGKSIFSLFSRMKKDQNLKWKQKIKRCGSPSTLLQWVTFKQGYYMINCWFKQVPLKNVWQVVNQILHL